jgi:uncharacterized membrane protein YsdA (DUF1294 family)
MNTSTKPAAWRSPKIIFALIALVAILILGALLFWFTGWSLFWIWLLVVNLVTFVLYGFDKAQAKWNRLRVPEIVLHGLALAGGFLGGWAGRAMFHHKTQKGIFTLVLVVSTVIYSILIFYLFWLTQFGG